MTIDKELCRNTYKLYQQWNDAELDERIRYAVIGGIALSQLKIGSPNSLMHLKIQKFLRNTKG